jgi:type I restriction enzyme M protein
MTLQTNIPSDELLCKFYTNPVVGKLLVGVLKSRRPSRVVDLCSGSGVLAQAARTKWKNSEIVTVDLDVKGVSPLLESRHIHHMHDALDPDLPALLSSEDGFDTAICNPPYKSVAWKSGFERVLDESGLADAYTSISDVNAEDLFLAQSVRLTKLGGRVGLIVPDGTITSRRSEGLRRKLIRSHRVDCVVQLPRGSFQSTDAQAFILVLSKGMRARQNVHLSRFDRTEGLSRPIPVDLDAAQTRLDYDFHFARIGSPRWSEKSLSSLVSDVRRGTLSSAEIRDSSLPVFHTGGFTAPEGHIRLPGKSKRRPREFPTIAEPGDILVARVDRNLHLKVGIVRSGWAVVSDCIWRIRVPECDRERVFTALRSPSGAAYLNSVARGVSARMLAKADLLAMPLRKLRSGK